MKKTLLLSFFLLPALLFLSAPGGSAVSERQAGGYQEVTFYVA